jgi:hypothetical protein
MDRHRKLQIRGVLDGLLTRYFNFHESLGLLIFRMKLFAIGPALYVQYLDGLTGPLRDEAVEQLQQQLEHGISKI